MIDRFRRGTPLKAGPNAGCRRRKNCKGLAFGGQCLKTDFATHDDWCNYMVTKLRKLYVERGGSPEDFRKPPKEDPEGLARLYNALKERVAEDEAQNASQRDYRDVH